MRIAIDLRPLMAGKTSGVEVYITSMLKALFEQDKENEYILWYNAFGQVDLSHFPAESNNVKIKHTRIPNKLFNLSLSLLRWPKLDKLIGKGIDVLWVPDPRPAPVSKACKKIITFHDLSFEDFKQSFNAKTRLWHRLLRPRVEASEATKIIAVSEFTKKQLIDEYCIDESKIEVIHEAAGAHIKPLSMPNSFELIKKKYTLPERYVLCLSTLEPRKNISGIIHAFLEWQDSVTSNVHLVIAGKKAPEIFSEIDLTEHPKIHQTGFIDEEDKALLYQHAMAFLYPSFYEGFGLPILEAMQCGTPVICSDMTSMPEVAGDAAILVNPSSTHEIKNAIHRLYHDERLMHEYQEKGLARAKEFSWERSASELLVLISG